MNHGLLKDRMQTRGVRVVKKPPENYSTGGAEKVAISETDRVRMAHEETRALFLEMRRLMIRLVNSIEKTYDLRESGLKSE